MFYKIGKQTFKILGDFLGLMQVTLVFFSFFTVLYWLLLLAKVPFVDKFTPFFNSILDFVHTFYNRTVTTEEATVDFSFLIFAFLLLGITWGLKFVVEAVRKIEEKYDTIYKEMKKQAESLFNLNLERSYTSLENKNKKFLVLIKFCAEDAEREMSYKAKPQEEIDLKQKSAMEEFAKTYSSAEQIQKKLVENSLLLCFNNFQKIDFVLTEIERNIENFKIKYRREKWEMISFVGLETYSNEGEIIEKYKKMRFLVKLNLRNRMVCLGTFKQRYLLVKDPKYFLDCKGVYMLDGQDEEVYSIKRRS